MVKLTINAVNAVKPGPQDIIVRDDEVTGFFLKVTPTGKKTFFLYYRTLDHVQRKPKLGEFPVMKPEQARSLAKEMLNAVRLGGDPSAARKARRANRGDDTVASLFDDYLKAVSKLRSVREIERLFKRDILPVLGKRRAEEVTRGEVTRLLDGIETRSRSVALAVRRQLSAFYTWALPRLPDSASNPVKSAAKVPPLASRKRVLSEVEVEGLWKVLDRQPEPWRSALRLLLLTGQRKNEVLEAAWSEFDLGQRMWTIPAVRAKNGKEHLVPLSPTATQILKGLPHGTGRLFPRGTGPQGRAAKRIREAMGSETPHWRWHDIRRTVATGMQRLGVQLEVTEAVLNHVSGSGAGIVGVYQLHHWAAEKRDALDAWGTEVERMVGKVSRHSDVSAAEP